MNILIINDDGIFAKGIYYLAKAMSKIAKIYISAPDSQRSATGHAITMHNPLKVKEVDLNLENVISYSIDGTPADCVKMGIDVVFKDVKIDYVISGINHGPNLGSDVIYSGTVSGAIEGFIQGKPSIAFSYNKKNIEDDELLSCANICTDIFKKIINSNNRLEQFILNVNIPPIKDEIFKGYKVTKLGNRKYINDFIERVNPMGETYYWMGGKLCSLPQDEDSDIYVNDEGYVSITPLKIDLTNYREMDLLKDELSL